MIVPRSTSEELPSATEAVHLLHNGDHMDAEEFHRRYLAMPQVNKAELIEGVVYMPSPVSHELHGKPHGMLMVFLGVYAGFTPGVTFSDNATVRLDDCNELQPDGSLMIQTDCGGQTRIVEGYIVGAPELIIEVAASTVSIDRHAKWLAYQRNGVREYLLWRVEDRALDWFRWNEGAYVSLAMSAEGVYRSDIFPGLWLSVPALLEDDIPKLLHTLQQGLASAEHAAFVARLQQARTAVTNPSTEVER